MCRLAGAVVMYQRKRIASHFRGLQDQGVGRASEGREGQSVRAPLLASPGLLALLGVLGL